MSPGFTIAPESERVLDAGAYVLGFIELALIVAALAIAARRVRSLILPGWRGAPAWLAEIVLGVAAVIGISETLGTFGAFGEVEMIVATLVVAGIAVVVCGRLARGREPDPSAPPAPARGTLAVALAVAAGAAVVAGWMVPTLGSLAGGMDRADTLWYHMPLAAKFVQTGSLGDIFFFDPIFFASFYPSNSEVLHAVPILAFGRDIVSPVLNLGFLSLGLLASWCIGRPYGVAPQALIGGSVALGAQMLVEFQAGEALNDITGVAFVLAAAALLVNGYAARRQRPDDSPDAPVSGRGIAASALAVAGLAGGIAVGIKLSFLAPVAALTIGVIVIAPAGARRVAALAWTLPVVAAGVYWYARNAIATGNPIPFVHSVGPIDLPAPERAFGLRPGFAVAHYWDNTQVWWDWFIPGLEESFGALWPVTLLAMSAGAVFAVWRGREPVLRLLGAMALFTAIAYVFTPLTAAGDEGQPIAFVWNVRYIAPAAAVALALIPCIPAARATAGRRLAVTVGLALLLAVTVGSLVQWQQGHVKGALAAAAGVGVAAAMIALLRSRNLLGPAAARRSVAAVGVAAVLVAGIAGWFEQRHYLERRYENTSPKLELASTLRWARDIRDARIAVSGIRGVFNQYPLYGTDLSNHVQWLGVRGDHDAWLRISTCERWRKEINAGDYTHVVTTYDPFHPGRLSDTKEALWTRQDPAAETVLREGPVAVFRINGEMNPAGCIGLPQLSGSELNGDSVNAEPLANQPPGTGPLDRRLRQALHGG